MGSQQKPKRADLTLRSAAKKESLSPRLVGASRGGVLPFRPILESCPAEAPVSRHRSARKDRPQDSVAPRAVLLQTEMREVPERERPDEQSVDSQHHQNCRNADGQRHGARRQALKQEHAPVLIGRVGPGGILSRSFYKRRHRSVGRSTAPRRVLPVSSIKSRWQLSKLRRAQSPCPDWLSPLWDYPRNFLASNGRFTIPKANLRGKFAHG